jgi:hypothetical protein
MVPLRSLVVTTGTVDREVARSQANAPFCRKLNSNLLLFIHSSKPWFQMPSLPKVPSCGTTSLG